MKRQKARCCNEKKNIRIPRGRLASGRKQNLTPLIKAAMSESPHLEWEAPDRAMFRRVLKLSREALPGEIERIRLDQGWPEGNLAEDFYRNEVVYLGAPGEARSLSRVVSRCSGLLKVVLLEPWRGDPVGSLIDTHPEHLFKPWHHEKLLERGQRGRKQKPDPYKLPAGLQSHGVLHVFDREDADRALELLESVYDAVLPVIRRFGLDKPALDLGDYGYGPGLQGMVEMSNRERIGECGATGFVFLTLRAPDQCDFLLPKSVLVEAAIHELTHLRRNGHDGDFWRVFREFKGFALERGILKRRRGTDVNPSRREPDIVDYQGDPRHRF